MFGRREFLMSGVGLTAALGVEGVVHAADSSGFKPTGQPWPVRNTDAFEYQSRAVGDKMAIGVWSPPKTLPHIAPLGDNPPLDVIYVLDGSFALNMSAAICMLQYADLINPGFPPVLLVGVDYPVGQPNARTRDYTMVDAVPASMKGGLSTTPATTPGGADKFLAFLEQELDPFIRSRYNTLKKPAGILGSSFGGTFTFYAFLKQSRLFDRYWLGSPGIFSTDADYVGQFETLLKGKLAHPTRMFLSAGSRELNGGVALYEELGQHFNRTISALNRAANDKLEWRSRIYDGQTHTSVFAPALNDALFYLLGR
ncbi:alpha/beta hydrolase [Peristeroidobacter soli]|uniref:alpha/beta hydrolase n=1 Tax=Peristeroidobacter soli TaxID=2497877 RepID=UPI00101D74DB|nr:alpha/beta hydrolase-fold protein [Peristeroidobacter soli]